MLPGQSFAKSGIAEISAAAEPKVRRHQPDLRSSDLASLRWSEDAV